MTETKALFIIFFAVVWAIAMGVWIVALNISSHKEMRRLNARIFGKSLSSSGKDRTPSSILLEEAAPSNRVSQILQERFDLVPKVEAYLDQADLRWRATYLLKLCLGYAAAGTLFGWLVLPIAKTLDVPLGMLTACGPLFYVWRRRRRKFASFEESFPDVLDFIARCMQSGHALSTSLQMTSREFPEPHRSEFNRIFDEHSLGLPLDVALQRLMTRIPLLDVRFFVAVVLLQKRTGGNLAEILERLGDMLRQRMLFQGRIKAISSHGRMTAISLSAIPLVVGSIMGLTSKDYSDFFFHDDFGKILLGAGVFLQLTAYAVMHKIVSIEV